jgi:hypothetical protein
VLAAPPPEPVDYPAAVSSLEVQRAALAVRHAAGEDVLDEARTTVTRALRRDIWPAWYGTPWEFYGTTETPRQGTIACGYFVSTTLEHAGLEVERVQLAQQASAVIVETFGPKTTTWGESPDAVLTRLDEGINLVGLDYHVAFLDRRGDQVWMCHSSVLEPSGVVCEQAEHALALESNVHVTGPLLTDRVVVAWLEGEALPTGG